MTDTAPTPPSFFSLKDYYVHAAAYLAAAATILSAVDPVLLPKTAIPYVTAAAALAAATDHAISSNIVPVTGASNIVKSFAVLAVAALGILLGGCVTNSAGQKVPAPFNTPVIQPVVNTVVVGAIVIAESKGITQAQINDVCKQAVAASITANASIDTVASVTANELGKLNLQAAALLAAQTLEQSLALVATQQMTDVKGNIQTDVAGVLTNVNDVATICVQATGG